jgi:hypothetical protein
MKLKVQFILAMLCLVGCSNSPTPIAIVISLPATPSPEILPTLTSTISPTELPSATLAVAPLPPALNTEIAPEMVGVCPVENPDLQPEFSFLNNDPVLEKLEPSLDFLNQGGSPDKLQPFFEQNRLTFYKGDLTDDGVPEIGLASSVRYDIVGCINGRYKPLLHFEYPQPVSVEVYMVRDLNLNGISDVVFFAPAGCGFYACFQASVLEWHQTEFQFLSKSSSRYESPYLSMAGPYTLEIKDVNDNGTLELGLTGGIPVSADYGEGLPWRVQTDIYMWDGEFYSLYRNEYAPPDYRFQAVQDRDEATRWGDYDRALGFYQQAVFDENLKPWSLAQHIYEWALSDAVRYPFQPSTPVPIPKPDPAEYPSLAAYARYRIMLLHLQQGHDSDAKVVYDTLQQKFPDGLTGHAYAEMATLFWLDYQEYHDLQQACAQAIKYATAHKQDILGYLGGDIDDDSPYYHGAQSHIYQPEDICPFH